MREGKIKLLFICLCLGACFLAACGDDDDDNDTGGGVDDGADDIGDDDTMGEDDTDDDDDADSFEDWFPPDPGPLGTYRIHGFSTYWDVPGEITGEDSTTFPGETYWVMSFGDADKGESAGAKIWADFSTPYKPGVKAMEGYEAGSENGVWSVREIFDDILYLAFDGDVGQTKSQTTTGTMYFPDQDPMDFNLRVDTTLTSLSASTDVPFGTVDNCIQALVKFSNPAYPDSSWGGDFFFHPVYGIVEAAVFPLFDVVELVSPAK